MRNLEPARTAMRAVTIHVLALLFAGCGGAQPSSPQRSAEIQASASPLLQSAACAAALAAHTGPDLEDAAVEKAQRLVLRAQAAAAQLEQLGWAYVAKGRASFDPGYFKLAEQTALCIDSLQPHGLPEPLESRLLRAHVLHQLHHFAAAEQLARGLVAERGYWFDYAILGDALMEQGKLREAVGAYQQMIDQKPGPQSFVRAAQLRWLTGDLSGAIDLMRSAARATNRRDADTAAWTQTRLATMLAESGATNEALTRFRYALSMAPRYAPAMLGEGRLLLAGGAVANAVGILREAARLNPLPEYQWALIEALDASGADASEVRSELAARGASEDPRSYSVFLASTGGDARLAMRLADEELKIRQDVFTFDAAAWAALAAGDLARARQFSRSSLLEGTNDARLLYHASIIAARSGDTRAARKLTRRLATLEQMLLPSERAQLRNQSAGQVPQAPTRVAAQLRRSGFLKPSTGD